MRRGLLVTGMLVLGGVLYGCAKEVGEGPGPGVRVRDDAAPYARIRYNTVVILDKSLEDWRPPDSRKKGKIAVEETSARRTETGTVEAWAVLRNRTDHPLQLEGRAHFFDKDKAPVEGPTAWQRVFLPAQGVGTYKEKSTKVMEVGYYYIEIREGR